MVQLFPLRCTLHHVVLRAEACSERGKAGLAQDDFHSARLNHLLPPAFVFAAIPALVCLVSLYISFAIALWSLSNLSRF